VPDPIETKRAPRTPYDAKFSLPYCLASQLVRGSVGIEAFTPTAITDRDVRALAALVSYERHDFATPTNEMMGGVRVRCHDGRVLDAPPRKARGAGGPPITESDVHGKFRTNARTALDPDAVVALEAAVTSLRTSPDLAALRVLRGSAAVTYP
jgi:2-methylcitrate dehydratase PrpD